MARLAHLPQAGKEKGKKTGEIFIPALHK